MCSFGGLACGMPGQLVWNDHICMFMCLFYRNAQVCVFVLFVPFSGYFMYTYGWLLCHYTQWEGD